MRIVVATTDTEWAAPLNALLREGGFLVSEVEDVFDAMALLAEPTVGLVVHASVGADEARLAVRSIQRRFGERVRVVGVGAMEDAPDDWQTNPYLYVQLVERLSAGRAPADLAPAAGDSAAGHSAPRAAATTELLESVSVESEEPAARPIETLGDVSRILQIARFGSYFELLLVARDAPDSAVVASASALRDTLDEETVPAHVVDVCYEELAEVRAAVDDAEGVLTSRRAREAYTRELGT